MLSRLKVQPSPKVEVSYILKADRPLTVQLYYSEDDGYNWIGPLKSVSGDVGSASRRAETRSFGISPRR